MDREGENRQRMRKSWEWISLSISSFSLHFLFISSFSLHFLFISSFSLDFLAARLQGCNDSCSPAMIYVNLYLQFQSLVSIFLFLFNFNFNTLIQLLPSLLPSKCQNLQLHVSTGFFRRPANSPEVSLYFTIFLFLCFYVSILKIFKLPPRSVWAFPTCQPTPPKVNFESVGTKSCLLQYEITYFQTIRRLSV